MLVTGVSLPVLLRSIPLQLIAIKQVAVSSSSIAVATNIPCSGLTTLPTCQQSCFLAFSIPLLRENENTEKIAFRLSSLIDRIGAVFTLRTITN